MSKTFSPKLLPFPEAKELADLELVKRDFEHVLACCSALLEQTLPLNVFDDNNRALLTSSVITYRRCFKSGVRKRLHEKWVESLGKAAVDTHKFVIGLADKHIAHSVNDFEQCGAIIHVAVDDEGVVHRSGLGLQASFAYEMSASDVRQFKDQVKALLSGPIAKRCEDLRSQAMARIEKLSDQEILSLPEGFAPEPKRERITQPRRWPRHLSNE